MTTDQYLVLGDWGSSVFRLYLCVWRHGQLEIKARAKGEGIKNTDDFEQCFFTLYDPWLKQYGSCPVYLIGAVGSNLGWNVAPYIECPADQSQALSQSLNFTVRDVNISILPGLKCHNQQDLPDIMRGEETQVFGFLAVLSKSEGQELVCLPGTHTKWVLCENGRIISFITSPVGELFDALCHHSALIHLTEQEQWCQLSFEAGLEKGLATSSNLLHTLFAVRSLQVVENKSIAQARSFLSGLIVGADVKAAMQDFHLFSEVTLIGSAAICQLYAKAATQLGISNKHYTCEQTSILGLQQLLISSIKEAV